MITIICVIGLLLIALSLLALYWYQDYRDYGVQMAYLASAKKQRYDQEEEELLELISDLDVQEEQIVQYHSTLQ